MTHYYEFHWKARNRFGERQKGKALSHHRADLEDKLISQGFSHIRIRRNFTLPKNPTSAEITRVIQQLGLLVGAGIPLKQALLSLQDNSLNIKKYRWLNEIISLLDLGFSFSDAASQTARFLTAQELQLIKMGEKSGHLALLLNKIADHRHKSEKLSQKVKKILFYPMMVLIVSLTLSLLLLLFIVPQFAELYQQKGHSLPFITSLLFTLSEFLQQDGLLLVILLFPLGLLTLYLHRKWVVFLPLKTYLLNRLPIFSQITQRARIVFFCQHTGLMLSAHIRLEQVLNGFLTEKSSDPLLQKSLKQTMDAIQKGCRFSESLNPALFPPEVRQMIMVGEKSGKLPDMLLKTAEIYQQELDDRIDILSQLLEPFLMLIIGAIIGTILIGLYLPIFDMGAMLE